VLFREESSSYSLPEWFGRVVTDASKGKKSSRVGFSAAQSAAKEVAEEFGVNLDLPIVLLFKV